VVARASTADRPAPAASWAAAHDPALSWVSASISPPPVRSSSRRRSTAWGSCTRSSSDREATRGCIRMMASLSAPKSIPARTASSRSGRSGCQLPGRCSSNPRCSTTTTVMAAPAATPVRHACSPGLAHRWTPIRLQSWQAARDHHGAKPGRRSRHGLAFDVMSPLDASRRRGRDLGYPQAPGAAQGGTIILVATRGCTPGPDRCFASLSPR